MKLGIGPPTASRRIQGRFNCALAVRWQRGGVNELGYISNLSLSGFCLRTRQIHQPGYRQSFVLSSDAGDVEVEAQVLWTRQLQIESHVNAWHEMGMNLAGAPSPEYVALFKSVENPPVERRRRRRFTHNLSALIRREVGEFEAKSVDVSEDGLLFVSDHLPREDERLTILLRLPGTRDPVEMKCRVVRLVDSAFDDKLSGFAVRFSGLSEAEEQMFINYLRIVKELHCFATIV